MDGRGRALDNVFVERLWRTVKQEEVYLKDYETVPAAVANLKDYFQFYNRERLHQSLGYRTPEAVYRGSGMCSQDWGEAIGGHCNGEEIYGRSTRL